MPSKRSPLDGGAVSALGDPRAVPDVRWIDRLTGAGAARVASVLREVGELVSFERRIRETHRAAGRSFYAQFRAPFDLYAMVRLLEPDHVIETGVSSGVSSAHVLLALRRNRRGILHSVDLPTPQKSAELGARESPVAIPPGRASGWAIPSELTNGWDLRIGPSQKILPDLVEGLESVGLFLHDSHHTPTHLTFELTTVEPRLVPGSVVLADNTEWTGEAFPAFARRLGAKVARRRRSDLVGLFVPNPAK